MSCVLTLALDDASQARFETLRQRYFPPERNLIPAHLTLFHMLPEDEATEAVLQSVAVQTTAFPLQVTRLRSMGRGVLFELESAELLRLHRVLRLVFEEELNRQDRQGFRPHIVVQNKATEDAAAACLAELSAGFAPWTCTAVGMDLWRYVGGPWQKLRFFPLERLTKL